MQLSLLGRLSLGGASQRVDCVNCTLDLKVQMRQLLVAALELNAMDAKLVALGGVCHRLGRRALVEVALAEQSQSNQELGLMELVQVFACQVVNDLPLHVHKLGVGNADVFIR